MILNSERCALNDGYVPEPETLLEKFDRIYNPNTTEGVSFGGNKVLQWKLDSGVSKCGYKIYQLPEIKMCLNNHYNKIQIFGDSRGRQYFSSIRPILGLLDAESNNSNQTTLYPGSKKMIDDPFIMFDSAWNFPNENREVWNSDNSSFNVWIDQSWSRRSTQVERDWYKRYPESVNSEFTKGRRLYERYHKWNNKWRRPVYHYNLDQMPNLVILPAMILHPMTMSGTEDRGEEYLSLFTENITNPFLESEYREAVEHFKEQCFPFIKFLLTQNPNIKFIILEGEYILPEIFEYDHHRNFYIRKYNNMLRSLIPDDGIDDQIYRLSVNTINIYGQKPGDYLLPDRVHLARKDMASVTPVTLLTNWNVMFNLLCNRYLGEEQEDLCCANI